jgi:hypothetical protein
MNAENIKLTEEETATIYRCRQKERAWATWGRFVALLIGAFDVIYSLVIFSDLSNIKIYGATEQTIQKFQTLGSLASGGAGFLLFMGIGVIILAIRFWNGNPTRTVLLKLIDRLTNQEKT